MRLSSYASFVALAVTLAACSSSNSISQRCSDTFLLQRDSIVTTSRLALQTLSDIRGQLEVIDIPSYADGLSVENLKTYQEKVADTLKTVVAEWPGYSFEDRSSADEAYTAALRLEEYLSSTLATLRDRAEAVCNDLDTQEGCNIRSTTIARVVEPLQTVRQQAIRIRELHAGCVGE